MKHHWEKKREESGSSGKGPCQEADLTYAHLAHTVQGGQDSCQGQKQAEYSPPEVVTRRSSPRAEAGGEQNWRISVRTPTTAPGLQATLCKQCLLAPHNMTRMSAALPHPPLFPLVRGESSGLGR